MQQTGKRRNLLPWWIGGAIILVVDVWIAFRMFSTSCPAPGFVEGLVIVVVPAVYLGLMYLTLKSQN